MNKYNAVTTVIDGIKFASGAEAQRYCELKLLEKAGEISGLEVHPRFQIVVNNHNVCTYIADFDYLDTDGKMVVEDVKGMKKGSAYSMFRIKKKLMSACYGIDVIET